CQPAHKRAYARRFRSTLEACDPREEHAGSVRSQRGARWKRAVPVSSRTTDSEPRGAYPGVTVFSARRADYFFFDSSFLLGASFFTSFFTSFFASSLISSFFTFVSLSIFCFSSFVLVSISLFSSSAFLSSAPFSCRACLST